MLPKLRQLITELKEEGLIYGLERMVGFLFRPFVNLIKKNQTLIEFSYGTLPKLKLFLPLYSARSGLIKFSQTNLVEEVRKFWYSNIPGYFHLDGEKISRKDIFTYGGPNPWFTCPICQKSEWLSRVKQKNLFIQHSCPKSEECQELCKKQGNEQWTYLHQNFDFMLKCDPNLPAPKGIYIIYDKKENFFTPRLEPMKMVSRRQFAFTGQLEVAERPVNINWNNYDFLFLYNFGGNWRFKRPDIPVIMLGLDFWEGKAAYQWVIDWVQPDVFLTSSPAQWKEHFRFPAHTKIVFYPLAPSLFFTRENLGVKQLDLVVTGAISSPLYKERVVLNRQIAKLPARYKVEFSNRAGATPAPQGAGTSYIDPQTKSPVRYLNKWSEYLGSAKYAVFGKMKYPLLVAKYFELLGSGAVPIFPEVPDLQLLGVKPFEHYIPLSEIEGNNEKLQYFLDNYDKFKYIAENAVKWHKENSDKMLFDDFENIIREITNYKYPKRLL